MERQLEDQETLLMAIRQKYKRHMTMLRHCLTTKAAVFHWHMAESCIEALRGAKEEQSIKNVA